MQSFDPIVGRNKSISVEGVKGKERPNKAQDNGIKKKLIVLNVTSYNDIALYFNGITNSNGWGNHDFGDDESRISHLHICYDKKIYIF